MRNRPLHQLTVNNTNVSPILRLSEYLQTFGAITRPYLEAIGPDANGFDVYDEVRVAIGRGLLESIPVSRDEAERQLVGMSRSYVDEILGNYEIYHGYVMTMKGFRQFLIMGGFISDKDIMEHSAIGLYYDGLHAALPSEKMHLNDVMQPDWAKRSSEIATWAWDNDVVVFTSELLLGRNHVRVENDPVKRTKMQLKWGLS